MPRLGVAESVADVASLMEGVERLGVAVGPSARVRLHDKVIEIGRCFPGLGEQLLGVADEALLESAAERGELVAARVAHDEARW